MFQIANAFYDFQYSTLYLLHFLIFQRFSPPVLL
nr:MAG TPA: hypothetical protein [Caudoviricetes sp.]